jgi:hypothetical protein
MELAQALLHLWDRKVWVAIGLVLAIGAGLGARQALKSSVYAAATTQMVVDSPRSALGDINSSLDPFTARAGVYALLMTSPQALNAIGREAGIRGDQIAAEGPPSATTPQVGQTPSTPSSKFKLQFNQDPSLPTVDIYSQAPTPSQAVALANAAVTGFANYLQTLEVQGSVPVAQRVKIRQLGDAIGGLVDAGSNTKFAAMATFVVFLAWCGLILFVAKLKATRTRLRAAGAAPEASAPAEDLTDPWPGGPSQADLEAVWSYAQVSGTRVNGAADRVSPGAESPSTHDES